MSSLLTPIVPAEFRFDLGLPYSTLFNDIYFSKENALLEALHVFINGNHLIHRIKNLKNHQHFVVGETGFGSGRNFLLTWSLWKKFAPKDAHLHFITCELHPFGKEDLKSILQTWPELKEESAALLKQYPVHTPGYHGLTFDDDKVHLTLMLGDAYTMFRGLLICGDAPTEYKLRAWSFDAWYLDGFTPSKNPKMWDPLLFKILSLLSKEQTTFATYTVANTVKYALKEAGFAVQQGPGYGQKKSMLTGFLQNKKAFKIGRVSAWTVPTPFKKKDKTAIVLGGGLAGCFMAHALAKRDYEVVLMDEREEVGLMASNNKAAIFHPKLSAFRSAFTEYQLSASLFAAKFYRQSLKKCRFGDLSGLLQLAYNEKERASQAQLVSFLAHYPELGKCIDAPTASKWAGIPLQTGGIFIPWAGWIDISKLCKFLIQHKNIHQVMGQAVDSFHYEEEKWRVGTHSASILILANGHRIHQFKETAHLPLKPMRGQMTFIAANVHSEFLKIPLCAEGHITPAYEGQHGLGATYTQPSDLIPCAHSEDEKNLKKIQSFQANIAWSQTPLSNWTSVRAATPDYLPLVGGAPDANKFCEHYRRLASNPKRWLAHEEVYYQGLYIFSGFGSRGLNTIPLSGEWLASFINQEPSILSLKTIESLSCARFLRRKLIRGENK